MDDEINLISEIREAERRAEEIIAAARIEGEAAIEKIRNEYREKTLLAEKEFLLQQNLAVERAASDAEREGRRIYEETDIEIEGIKRRAEKNFSKAADFLVRKILE